MEEKDVIGHIIDMKADIASIKTTLEETVQPLVLRVDSQQGRLGRVESDVKSIRRIFGGLWLLVVAGIGAVATWLRG